MSRWSRTPVAVADFDVDDAYVKKIYSVVNPVMRALVKEYHRQSVEFAQNIKVMPLAEAQRIWRQDPHVIDYAGKTFEEGGGDEGVETAGVFEEEATNIDAYIDEMMQQDTNTFNADRHDWYQRHKRALRIRATALVEYNGGRSQARVVGDWCTLSSAVRLRIRGRIESQERSLGETPFLTIDASRSSPTSGIELMPIEVLEGSQFVQLLQERGGMGEIDCQAALNRFFSTPSAGYEKDAEEEEEEGEAPVVPVSNDWENPVIFSRSQHARAVSETDEQRMMRVARERAAKSNIAYTNKVTLDDFWQRVQASDTNPTKLLETEYISLGLRMVLLSRELVAIGAAYESRDVQLDAVARGHTYICEVARLLRHEPHVLCFRALRAKLADEKEIPAIKYLNDLKFERYEELILEHRDLNVSPVIRCAIDAYAHIIRHDVYGDGKPPSDGGFTGGHMFSVFGADSSHRFSSYYHGTQQGRSEQPDPIDKLLGNNSLSHIGSFALADKPLVHDKSGRELLTQNVRYALASDVQRLRNSGVSTDLFVAALRWMEEQGIVKTMRFAGTGPYNTGAPVDAFYMADLFDGQTRVTELLADIYRRGLMQTGIAVNANNEEASPDMIAVIETYQEQREAWQKEYVAAVRSAAAIAAMAAEVPRPSASSGTAVIANAVTRADKVAQAQIATTAQDKPPSTSLMSVLARRIARAKTSLTKRYKETWDGVVGPEKNYYDACDAYNDARDKRWLERPTLKVVHKPELLLDNDKPFADEQVQAIDRMSRQPITVLTGRGGVGKSETLAYVCKKYPRSQVLCVAFTGQVASELSRRTGAQASTIHSALFRHSHYIEGRNRSRSNRKRVLANINKNLQLVGENYTLTDIEKSSDERELRAYVEHELECHPPFTSPFRDVRVLIVDEVTLVAFPLFRNLLEAAHCPAEGRFIERLILVGDLDQLPAIGFGNVMSDIAHGMPHAVCELVINHRSTGTELFTLAQALAEHRYNLPMPKFDMSKAIEALRKGTGDVVCIETHSHDVGSKLEFVLKLLKAHEDEGVRRTVQCIATTNEEVKTANKITRWLYYGAQVQVAVAKKKDADEVQSVREQAEKQLEMRVVVGDRIYLKKNSRVVYPSRFKNEPVYEKLFFNSRLLEAVQFYNTMARITKTTVCRCGLCPPIPDKAPKGFRNKCMARLDQVPPLRRKRTTVEECGMQPYYAYHDDKMPKPIRRQRQQANGAPQPDEPDVARRMAVFRDESGNYVELDVATMMQPRSKFDFGYALTTHKMQGSQQDVVIYICTDARAFINCKFLYTAVTRARKRVIIMSNNIVFDQLSRRKEPPRRSGFFAQLFDAIGAVWHDIAARRYSLNLLPDGWQEMLTVRDRWQVFEKMRYRTDRPRPLAAVLAAAEQEDDADGEEGEVLDIDDDEEEEEQDEEEAAEILKRVRRASAVESMTSQTSKKTKK